MSGFFLTLRLFEANSQGLRRLKQKREHYEKMRRVTRCELLHISQRFFSKRYENKEVMSPTAQRYIHSRGKLDILPPSSRIALIGP